MIQMVGQLTHWLILPFNSSEKIHDIKPLVITARFILQYIADSNSSCLIGEQHKFSLLLKPPVALQFRA